MSLNSRRVILRVFVFTSLLFYYRTAISFTKGIVADDGFKEFRSNVATTFDPSNLDNYWSKGDCRSIVKK
jgi:hypothetical protein